MELRKNQQLDVTVESFGAQGEGVAKWNGMPIFIPCALPGEQIRVHIVKTEKRFAFGKIAEILQPSPSRVTPPCPYYSQCGGCSCQHMTYDAQLEFKRMQVENCMRHIAMLDVPVLPVLGMDDPWHYRNKISMPVSGTSEAPLIGYYASRSHRVIDVNHCMTASEASDRVFSVVRRWMKAEKIAPYQEETHRGLIRHVMVRESRKGEIMAVMIINARQLPHADSLLSMLRRDVPKLVSLCVSPNEKKGNVILGDEYTVLWGKERLEDELCGNRFSLSPLSFFQINPTQTEKLYRTALDFAGLDKGKTAADLYCGAGTISLLLAGKADHVTGVEIVPDAIRDARVNAKANGVNNVDYICGAAETVMPELVRKGMRPDVVVLDPPRKGAESSVLQAILQCAPEKVVYVSCNPATQARDCRILCDGGYHAVCCQPVDMFCQTTNVETVCLLSKISSAPHIDIDLDLTELDVTAAETKATYEEIKAYVFEHTGLKVSCLYIAQVKARHGIIERDCYNKAKTEGNRVPKCPPEKEKAIEEALRHFRMIP